MNAEALVRRVADRFVDTKGRRATGDIRKILQALVDTVLEALHDGDQVFLMNLGRFYVKRTGRHSGRPRYGIFFRAQPRVSAQVRKQLTLDSRSRRGLGNSRLALARLTGRCPKCDQPLAAREPPACSKCGEVR